MKPFRSNLCAFLGRKSYIDILHVYVEKCLELNIVDRYYIFDLSNDIQDHYFLKSEYERLSKIFQDRVFLVNYEKRENQFKTNSIKASLGKWGDFYSYLSNFDDNDVVVKIDDDTLFIDPEGFREALQARWHNKTPFLMHSNCINNGICAYHQSHSNIWNAEDNRSKMYPCGGIAGPIFLWPDLACDFHNQFTDDLIQDSNNIDKYKLNKNIFFNSRVSINFTLMLGSDREHLIDVDTQDEYLISSKIPQKLGRSNMILGDFITSHYTYGVQKILIEQHPFLEKYKKISELYLKQSKKTHFSFPNNKCSTIEWDNFFVSKSWIEDDSFTIRNLRTLKYMCLDLKPRPKIDYSTKNPSGDFIVNSVLSGSDRAQAFGVNGNIFIHNEIFQTRDLKKVNKKEFQASFVSKFYQKNFSKNGINIIPCEEGGSYIESSVEKGSFLRTKESKGFSNIFYFFDKRGKKFADLWDISPQKHLKDKVFLSKIIKSRSSQEFENDDSYMESSNDPSVPSYVLPRSFQWTVDKHLWEFQKLSEGIYYIMCINNEKENQYLNYKENIIEVSDDPLPWKLIKEQDKYKIFDQKSNKYLNCEGNTNLTLELEPSLFRIKI